MSTEHLDRYVTEFSERQNQLSANTIIQMAAMVRGMDGKWVRYQGLIS